MTLTFEQQQALEQLARLVPKSPARPGVEQVGSLVPTQADLLRTWLGVPGHDLRQAFKALLLQKENCEQRLLEWVETNPLEASFEFLGLAAWAFYQAEKGSNPKIGSYLDALYYISTCASVGYADVFAVTQSGRAIAALVMILGPALTNKTLDRPKTN